MKVACVDKTASDRIKLEKLFDSAFEQCRNTFGHLTIATTYPATLDDLLLNKPPQLIAIGAGFSIEEAHAACRKIHSTYSDVPVFLFLSPDTYSLRGLRRFQTVTTEIFSTDESAIRLVHKLTSLNLSAQSLSQGKLVTISGVKGGVGATSVVSALVHAAEAVGKQAIVVDLSEVGAFARYMSIRRPHSPDHAALITDSLTPDRVTVERCVATAANGVRVLLAPTGGTDTREQWIRDASRLEVSLSVIHLLREMFDLIFVDTGNTEGIFPFALQAQADTRILVTSNDPASVHLLNSRLSTLAQGPGESAIHILVNVLIEKGLTKEDIIDFLVTNENFEEHMALLAPIPFDSRGQNWIGTGNTFYTESSVTVQELFEDIVQTIALSQEDLERRTPPRTGLFNGIKRITRGPLRLKATAVKALPAPHDIPIAAPPVLRPTNDLTGPLWTAPQASSAGAESTMSSEGEIEPQGEISQFKNQNQNSLFELPRAVGGA